MRRANIKLKTGSREVTWRPCKLLKLLKKKNGWGDFITSESRHPHETIDLFVSATDHIIKKCVPLYEKGHSLTEVSDMTGVPVSSIFEVMKSQKKTLRSAKAAQKTNPPFGYAWLSGKLVVDPTEYRTIELIQSLRESGMRPFHIEKHLNQRNIPTRNGGRWFARVITNILEKNASRSRSDDSNSFGNFE